MVVCVFYQHFFLQRIRSHCLKGMYEATGVEIVHFFHSTEKRQVMGSPITDGEGDIFVSQVLRTGISFCYRRKIAVVGYGAEVQDGPESRAELLGGSVQNFPRPFKICAGYTSCKIYHGDIFLVQNPPPLLLLLVLPPPHLRSNPPLHA